MPYNHNADRHPAARGGHHNNKSAAFDQNNRRRPPASFQNLFCARLPPSMNDQALLRLFDGLGPTAAKVMRSERTGGGKGFGFVLFASEAEGKHAHTVVVARRTAGELPVVIDVFPSRHTTDAILERIAADTAAAAANISGFQVSHAAPPCRHRIGSDSDEGLEAAAAAQVQGRVPATSADLHQEASSNKHETAANGGRPLLRAPPPAYGLGQEGDSSSAPAPHRALMHPFSRQSAATSSAATGSDVADVMPSVEGCVCVDVTRRVGGNSGGAAAAAYSDDSTVDDTRHPLYYRPAMADGDDGDSGAAHDSGAGCGGGDGLECSFLTTATMATVATTATVATSGHNQRAAHQQTSPRHHHLHRSHQNGPPTTSALLPPPFAASEAVAVAAPTLVSAASNASCSIVCGGSLYPTTKAAKKRLAPPDYYSQSQQQQHTSDEDADGLYTGDTVSKSMGNVSTNIILVHHNGTAWTAPNVQQHLQHQHQHHQTSTACPVGRGEKGTSNKSMCSSSSHKSNGSSNHSRSAASDEMVAVAHRQSHSGGRLSRVPVVRDEGGPTPPNLHDAYYSLYRRANPYTHSGIDFVFHKVN